jgi:hypothetical protein
MRDRVKLNMVMFSIYAMLVEIKFKSTINQPLNEIFFSRHVGPSHLYGPISSAKTLSSLLVTFSLKQDLLLVPRKNDHRE